jgi:hypothetical protein
MRKWLEMGLFRMIWDSKGAGGGFVDCILRRVHGYPELITRDTTLQIYVGNASWKIFLS